MGSSLCGMVNSKGFQASVVMAGLVKLRACGIDLPLDAHAKVNLVLAVVIPLNYFKSSFPRWINVYLVIRKETESVIFQGGSARGHMHSTISKVDLLEVTRIIQFPRWIC
jgi:hypothetical protein